MVIGYFVVLTKKQKVVLLHPNRGFSIVLIVSLLSSAGALIYSLVRRNMLQLIIVTQDAKKKLGRRRFSRKPSSSFIAGQQQQQIREEIRLGTIDDKKINAKNDDMTINMKPNEQKHDILHGVEYQQQSNEQQQQPHTYYMHSTLNPSNE